MVVTGLVTRARNGERQAWDGLVERYAPLIWSICRRHRLEAADAEDAAQNVWLKLVDQLDSLRDPAALPAWLATTTRARMRPHPAHRPQTPRRRSCAGRRGHPGQSRPGGRAGLARGRAARPCVRRSGSCPRLPAAARPAHRRSCAVVCEISASLGVPVGSIGPSRRRCLDKLRRHPAITALINADT